MNQKTIYDKLARTPKLSARRVKILLENGVSCEEILARFGNPQERERVTQDPFLTPGCPGYPQKLLQLADPPLRLFHQGHPPDHLDDLVVGVVGSRKASHFGSHFAAKLGGALSRHGVKVCSGLAYGIDAEAHRGVLKNLQHNTSGGQPIGILGHGWGHMHPKQHLKLAEEVSRRGALLTEYSRDTPPSRWTFPARNRIIAALSDHLVVVEAGPRSGSLHTANFALDLGRHVWVVPNAPGRPNSAGVLRLLSSGASPIIDLEEFVEIVAPSLRKRKSRKSEAPSLCEESRSLLQLIARTEGSFDRVAEASPWTVVELAHRLAELELENLIQRTIDGNWSILRWDLVGELED